MVEATSTIIPSQYFFTALAWRCLCEGVNLGDLPNHPVHDQELGCRRIRSSSAAVALHPRVCVASTASAYPGFVGTSTSCSASCGSRAPVRTGTSSPKILGTSITCSGSGMSVSKKRRVSANCSTAAQVHREFAPREQSRRSRRCAPRCAAGPELAAPASQPSWKAAPRRALLRTGQRAPAGEEESSRPWPCTSLSSSPALAFFCPRRAEWCRPPRAQSSLLASLSSARGLPARIHRELG